MAPPFHLDRRSFLCAGAALAAGLLAFPGGDALAGTRKLGDVSSGPHGATLRLALEHGPFPCPGAPYEDPTTMVFVPRHYRAPDSGRLDVLVHFHGHNTTIEEALAVHAIREQLHDSKQNAILVAPQLAVRAADGAPGKLEQEAGLVRMLAEVASVVASSAARKKLGDAAIARRPKLGTVAISAHSGGYRAAASSLQHGGADVSEVYLFDALYGEVQAFRDWVLARKDDAGRARHKLVSHFVSTPVRSRNRELEAALEAAGVRCAHESTPGELSRAELTTGRAIFIDGQLSHDGVTHEQNELRDCLFASSFTRSLESDWFEDKDAPRALDPREATR